MIAADARILAVGVGKRYVKFDDEAQLATKRARLWSRTHRGEHWALRDLDLEVHPGESIGLIGRNGSGKSTLLRMLAGVTAPTEGRIRMRGRVAPLIAVGVGFHPELTGRENVFVNGAILGVPRKLIEQQFDEIVDFAGIEAFIDTPVKFYSSGMFVRLGFGVSMFARPDVLLVDEVLAVGDFAFQLKCFDQMDAARNNGTAIIVVSHMLSSIRRLCSKTLLLEKGSTRFFGETTEAIAAFHEVLGEARDVEDSNADSGPRNEDIDVIVEPLDVQLLNGSGAAVRQVATGEPSTFVLDGRLQRDLVDPIVFFRIFGPTGTPVYGETTMGVPTGTFRQGSVARFAIDLRTDLATGSYSAEFEVKTAQGEPCLRPHKPLLFFVAGRESVLGAAADLHGRIQVSEAGASNAPDQAPAG